LPGQIHGRYLSQQTGADKKGVKSHGYLNVGRDLQRAELNGTGRSGFLQSGQFTNSPYTLAQKHQQKQQKWQDILKNKEGVLQSRHKKMKD